MFVNIACAETLSLASFFHGRFLYIQKSKSVGRLVLTRMFSNSPRAIMKNPLSLS